MSVREHVEQAIVFWSLSITLFAQENGFDPFQQLEMAFCSSTDGIWRDALSKFVPTRFGELDFNAFIASSFSILQPEVCIPYFVNQHKDSLLCGMNLSCWNVGT